MLQKTKGIVINHVKYRESSIIVNIYTEAYGMRSYIENGVRAVKSKNKIALFQPLTLLELVVFEKESKAISRLAEIKCYQPYHSLPYNHSKASIAIFLAEVLKKSLREESANQSLYYFLEQAFLYLDLAEDIENFHLVFLVKLMEYLGFAPPDSETLLEEFLAVNMKSFSPEQYHTLNLLIGANFDVKLELNRKHRHEMLDLILSFYRIHVADFGQLQSHWVLKEVWD